MKNMHTYTTELPVSAKFYKRLIDRVHTVIISLGLPDPEQTENDTLALIHHYLSAGNSDAPICEIGRIIFLTLRAEIDAAIIRSRRARAAAAARRAATTPTLKSDLSDKSDKSDLSDPSEKSEKSLPSEKSPAPPRTRFGLKFRPVTRKKKRRR